LKLNSFGRSAVTVQTILKQKANGNAPKAVTVQSSASVMEAARKLAQFKIGAVIITKSDGSVAGIVSERDIVRRIADAGPEILSAPVRDVMTRDVITCTAETSIDEVMTRMTHGRFRHVPVVDAQDRLIDVISIGDVVKKHVAEVEHEASSLRAYISTH
jgi:CBS domain-containing protein